MGVISLGGDVMRAQDLSWPEDLSLALDLAEFLGFSGAVRQDLAAVVVGQGLAGGSEEVAAAESSRERIFPSIFRLNGLYFQTTVFQYEYLLELQRRLLKLPRYRNLANPSVNF